MAWSNTASEAGTVSIRPPRRVRTSTSSRSMPASRSSARSSDALSLQSPNRARQHLGDPVGLVAVDAELQRHVAGALEHPAGSSARTLSASSCAPRRGLGGGARRERVVGGELILDQAPVPAAHVLPASCRC